MIEDKNKMSACTCNPLINTLNKCLESLYEVYFQPRSKNEELHYIWRLLCTFTGACAFHFWYYSIVVGKQRNDILAKFIDSTDSKSTSSDIFGDAQFFIDISTASTSYTLITGGAFALVYSLVLSSGYSRHGPARYFLGGLMLSALVLFIASSVSMAIGSLES